jgi:hypothetical protein
MTIGICYSFRPAEHEVLRYVTYRRLQYNDETKKTSLAAFISDEANAYKCSSHLQYLENYPFEGWFRSASSPTYLVFYGGMCRKLFVYRSCDLDRDPDDAHALEEFRPTSNEKAVVRRSVLPLYSTADLTFLPDACAFDGDFLYVTNQDIYNFYLYTFAISSPVMTLVNRTKSPLRCHLTMCIDSHGILITTKFDEAFRTELVRYQMV